MDITKIVAVMLVLGVRFLYAPGPVNDHVIRQGAQLYMPLDLDVQEENDDDDQSKYDTQEEDYEEDYYGEEDRDDKNPIR